MKDQYDFRRAKRGAVVPVPRGKTRVTLPLDDDLLEWFRRQIHARGGGDYSVLINEALRGYVKEQQEPLEKILRRVVREELASSHRSKNKRTRQPA